MAAPRKDNVKEIIINATEELLKTSTLADLSLAQIAKAAGISKGTLYYHYKTKNEILFDITDRYLSAQWQNLIDWTEDGSKDTSLHRLVKYVLERNIGSAGIRMHLICDAMLGDEEIRQKLIERYSQFHRLISQKISERTDAVPADYFTWLILLASDGLIVQEVLGNENIDTKQFIAQSAAWLRTLPEENSDK